MQEQGRLARNELIAQMKGDFSSLWKWLLVRYWLMAARAPLDKARVRFGRIEARRTVALTVNGVPVTLQTTFTPNRVTFEAAYPPSASQTNQKGS